MQKLKKLRRFSDARGYLVENTDTEMLASSKHFLYTISYPGIIRGNHYHKRKIEWFCIIRGTCRFVTEDIKTKHREETIVSDKDDTAFRTVPFVAHAMENIGEGEMIFLGFVNEVLDQTDPDTYAYKVL